MNPCIITRLQYIHASTCTCTFIMRQCRFWASKVSIYELLPISRMFEGCSELSRYAPHAIQSDIFNLKIVYFVSANICSLYFDDKPSRSIAQSLQSILQLLRTFLKNYIGGLQILFVSEPTYRHIHKEME